MEGAGRDHDGANAQQHLSQSVVRNTPVEVLEQRAPLLHHRVELVPDSGGAGRYRGGVGVRREVEMLAPCEVLSMKKKTKTSPWSLAGGHAVVPVPQFIDELVAVSFLDLYGRSGESARSGGSGPPGGTGLWSALC